MIEALNEILEAEWRPVTLATFAGASAAIVLLFLMIWSDDDGYLLLLDGANLLFHEAGHPIFGILGEALGLYGGTLGQLTIPLIVMGSFWSRRHAAGCAVAGVWLGQNFLNIARYMADARAQELPLVGGGEHDWYHIFMRWNVLFQDTRIAGMTSFLGWMVMLAAWAWLGWRFLQDRGREEAF